MEKWKGKLVAEGEQGGSSVRPADLGIGKLFGRVRDAVVVAHAESQRIVLWNAAAERMFGYAAREALNLKVEALVPRALKGRHRDGMDRYGKTGHGLYIDSGAVLDLPAVRKDGARITVDLSLSPIDYEGGEGRFVLAIIRETTEKKMAAEEHARLAALVEGSDDAIIGGTLSGTITSWNRGAEKVYGYTRQEVLEKQLSVLAPRDKPDEIPEILAKIRRGETVDHYETVQLRKDGRKIYVSMTVSPTRDAEGNTIGVATIARDVTKRREAEKLRRQNAFYETLLKIQSDIGEGLIIVDGRRIVYANQAFADMSGYALPDLYAMPSYLDLLVPEERERVGSRLSLGPGHPDQEIEDRHETIMMSKDGERVFLDVAVKAFITTGNAQLVAITSDITERKNTEANLRRSLQGLLALHEATQVFGSTLDPDEVCRRLLAMAERVSGLEAAAIHLRDEQEDMTPRHATGDEGVLDLAASSPEAEAARRAALESGERRIFVLYDGGSARRSHGSGACLPLMSRDLLIGVLEAYGPANAVDETTLEMLGSLANQAAGALENARLYAELARHERQLRELVGKLLDAQEEERRHVAYDIHDGLTQVAIAAYQHLQTFAEDHPPGTPVEEGELDRALALTHRTVSDARQVIAGLRPTALDDFGLAATIRQELAPLQTEGFEVHYTENLGERRLPAQIETALYRVFQEAMTNVRKHSHARRVEVSLTRRAARVMLEVRDDGRGFEPRSVPEAAGPGERVGLSSMRERISLLGGRLDIQSRPGEGATVSAEVPV